jgi:hypothetical protein
MSAPQLATVLEAAHNVAPNYTLKKHQCYWYTLTVFLIVRAKTAEVESNKDCIEQRGRLWWIPRTYSADDDENIVHRAGHRLPYDGTVRVHNTVAVTVPSVS